MYDCSVRVPLVISWPGHFKSGLRCDALVELVDIVPTLLDAAGIPIPSRVQGKSLHDLCAGSADPHHHKDCVYTEYYVGQPFHRALSPQPLVTMARNRTHKVSVFHGMEVGEMYDLQADPDEFENLWAGPKHRDLKTEMLKLCFDASVLTQDPLPERTADW
jgi:arylsulfatase